MPYLTPDDVPETSTCRSLLIPSSSEWLAIFSGALTELTYKYNWEQSESGITIEEALSVVNAIINAYYTNDCENTCALPGGSPVFRINSNYVIEQLVNGEWVEPEGDYTLPPTPAREEPTEEERKCLAAANAVNALKILYEQLADSYQDGQDASTAAAALLVAIIGAIGAVFGIIVAPLLALFAAIFAAVYATVEFITADLWTVEFDHKLQCYFYECATETEDVVHFDMPCIVGKIGEATDLDWSFSEVRLLLQVGGIMNMLGSQTIDAAGATTAITSADCSDCEDPCTFYLNGEGLKSIVPVFDTTYDSMADELDGAYSGPNNYASFTLEPPLTAGVIGVSSTYIDQGSLGNFQIYLLEDDDYGGLYELYNSGNVLADGSYNDSVAYDIFAPYNKLYVTLGANGASAHVTITAVSICPPED